MANAVKYTIIIKNRDNEDTANLQEAYSPSLQQPDYQARARQLFEYTNSTRGWNTTYENCDVSIHKGEWVGVPDSVID